MGYKVVEQLNDTQSAIRECIEDLDDIERIIDELNKKKSTIIRRMTRNSDRLKLVISDSAIVGILTRDAIQTINELITNCDNYIQR